MRNIIFILLFLAGCSSAPQTPTISTGHRVLKQTFYQVEGAGEVLRKKTQATLAIWIKPKAEAQSNEDIFNISVGGKVEDWKTRAGFRVIKGGAFQSVARASDTEELSEINTNTGLQKINQWQHVALTIDYTKKEMLFYIDGNPASTVHKRYHFSQPQTSDTWSHRVTLGSEDNGAHAYFNGELAGAFVEPRILSEIEIKNLMGKTRP